MRLRLGTRESDLALARGHYVAEQLRELGHEVELVVLSNTAGAASGMPGAASTKGEFARALRAALYDGSCDVVVHGVKDIPLSQEDATGIARPAVLERSNPFDALCSWDDVPLDKLPRRSRVGTSSLRRIAQLRRVRPDLVIVEVQGTFADRLRRVEPGDLDAVIVSMEGLERLGLEDRASEVLRFIPAPGQGALALECREEDVEIIDALKVLDDHETRISATAEREVLRDLDVDYSAPIGALALRQVVLSLRAVAFSVAGDRKIDLQLGMPTSMLHAKRSGRRVAQAHEFCNRAEVDAAGVLEGNEDDAWRAQPPAEAIRLFLPRQEGRLAGGLRDVGFAVDAVALQHAQLIDAENRMADADWVVVPSAHAAWALREKGWYIPPDKRVAAMGETTRSILEQAGVKVQVGPGGTASSDRLVAEFGPGEGQLVVIPCGRRSQRPGKTASTSSCYCPRRRWRAPICGCWVIGRTSRCWRGIRRRLRCSTKRVFRWPPLPPARTRQAWLLWPGKLASARPDGFCQTGAIR
ncbi:MAG: hydroxymethylbilane synthase [Propionibacterium sp.]|nr:MAG: hydroxymethylbilane synthase [Propionibacterium sp.]